MPCCWSFKRRYERYILKVYPSAPGDGIDAAALGQLTFYALSQRNMLPKIGKFTARRISHDMNRSRLDRVKCGMQIFQALLDSCHSELKLFSEPYLRTVCGLLGSNNIEYQQIAVQSFQRFALIEEETTAYQRHYDELVSMFSSMCWKIPNPIARRAGLEGIKAIFQKSLVKGAASLWEEVHLSLILPALLNNIKSADFGDTSDAGDDVEKQLPRIALSSLRDLAGRASFGNVKILLRPVFLYFDKFGNWNEDDDFAGLAFRYVMTSIQPQYTHVAVSSLLHHMDSSQRLTARDKTGIIKVLSSSLTIAADRAIGPSIIEMFNTLLRHLRLSAESDVGADNSEEVRFQSAIVDNCGEFANHLADTQKVEILTFILGKIPTTSKPRSKSCLLRCLASVARTYASPSLRAALPDALLNQLLAVFVDQDAEVRELAAETFLHLLTASKKARGTQEGANPVSKGDLQFVRDKSETILWHVFSACRRETPSQLRALPRLTDTVVVLASEYGMEQMLDTIRMALALQTTDESVAFLYAAFNAAFLKRLAVIRGYDSLATFVDETIVPFPLVADWAAKLAPLHLFPTAGSGAGTGTDASASAPYSSFVFEASAVAAVLVDHVEVGDVRARLAQPYHTQPTVSSARSKVRVLPEQSLAVEESRSVVIAVPPDAISFASIKKRLTPSGDGGVTARETSAPSSTSVTVREASAGVSVSVRDASAVWDEYGGRQERMQQLTHILPQPAPHGILPHTLAPAAHWLPLPQPAIFSF